jgi:hypothetical protein
MNPPTLADLRRNVSLRIRDFERKIAPLEIDAELNRNLDLLTRDTDLVQGVIIFNLVANQSLYQLIPDAGYQIGRILSVKSSQNGVDAALMQRRTAAEMDREIVDWRNTTVTSNVPVYYVLDYDANTSGNVVTQQMYVWPLPATSYAPGIIVTCVFTTDGLLVSDGSQIPIQAMYAKEWLIESTCANLLERLGETDRAMPYGMRAMKEGRHIRRRASSDRGSVGGTKVWW